MVLRALLAVSGLDFRRVFQSEGMSKVMDGAWREASWESDLGQHTTQLVKAERTWNRHERKCV